MHIARARGEFLLEEDGEVDLPDEADALRVLALGSGQTLLRGDAPHLGLEQPAHGEECVAELFLRELAEEIALVLVGIAAREQAVDGAAVRCRRLVLAAVVARSHVVGAQPERFLEEDVEFDLAVAQHVGIGRAAPFVFGEHIVHHALAVVFREVRHVQRNVEPLGDQLREGAVVVPRAVAFERARRVVPVDHEEADHLVSLPFEQIGGHRRIDATRKSDYHTCHLSIVVACRLQIVFQRPHHVGKEPFARRTRPDEQPHEIAARGVKIPRGSVSWSQASVSA